DWMASGPILDGRWRAGRIVEPDDVRHVEAKTARGGHGKGDRLITRTHTSLVLATALAVTAVALPATAAAEPKNDVPFIAAKSAPAATAELKNEVPFVTANFGATQKTMAQRATIARHRALGRLPVTAAKSQPSPVDRIIAQERGRRGDPLVFGLPQQASVQILQRPSAFDWADAGPGGATTLALVLLAAGGAALWH